MKIGFLGLGKLGLPVALAVESKGHEVKGYDPSPIVQDIIKTRTIPYMEEGAQELLNTSKIEIVDVDELVSWSDILFVPIQTPHKPEYEGVTLLGDKREDFDYSYLVSGIAQIARSAQSQNCQITVVVISTCLPGTYEREIERLLNKHVNYIYNPFFIAMGTTIADFLNPEFVLIGARNGSLLTPLEYLKVFYDSIHKRPLFVTDIKTAELTKVAYNTFIGQKITFANAMMEICHKIGANVDDLTSALSLATSRIISPKYMSGGMGDGGGCHPRDNIAMSWMARELNLSHDIFSDQMKTREDQTKWLVNIILDWNMRTKLPIILMGKEYKPDTNLIVGSPARLLSNILRSRGIVHDFYDNLPLADPAIYFISTKHSHYPGTMFPRGSVVIDPFGYIPDQSGVTVIRIGRMIP